MDGNLNAGLRLRGVWWPMLYNACSHGSTNLI
jgi:hypothetical protein